MYYICNTTNELIKMLISKIRKSGNSTVLVLPPDAVKGRNLRVGESVEYEIFRKVDLKNVFGKGKHLKINSQKAKDMLREEW